MRPSTSTRARTTIVSLLVAGAGVGCGSAEAVPDSPNEPIATVTAPATTETKPQTRRSERARKTTREPLVFATTPIVRFAELIPGGGNYLISIIFKMRRLLPETSRRSVKATVLVGDAGSMFPLGRFSPRRPCYDQEFDDAPPGSPLETPRDGQRVTVTVRIKREPTRKATIGARLRKASPKRVEEPTSEDVARIGCPGKRPG